MQQQYFGLPASYYAQQPGTDGKVVFNQPKVEELSDDAQNMIDAFSDANTANYNKMAALIETGKYLEVGTMLAKLTQEWKSQIV